MFPLLWIQQSSVVRPSLWVALSLISFRPNAFQIFAQLTVWSIFIFTPSLVFLLSKQIFIAACVIKAMPAQWMLIIRGRWGGWRLRGERNQVDSEQWAVEAKHKNNAGTGLSGLALSQQLVCSYTVSHNHLRRPNGMKRLVPRAVMWISSWFVSDFMLSNYWKLE